MASLPKDGHGQWATSRFPTDDSASPAADPAATLMTLMPRVRNLVRFLVRGDRDADDITQEVLVVVLRGLPGYRALGPIEAWTDRTVARATFSELRRRRAERRLVSIADDGPRVFDEPAVEPDEYLQRRWAIKVLDELPDEQRHSIVLHHLLDMSVPEVARELGVPAETVRSRLRVGRARLRARSVRVGSMSPEDE